MTTATLRPAGIALTSDGIELVGKVEHAITAYGIGLLVLYICTGYRTADVGILSQNVIHLEADCCVFLFQERVGNRGVPDDLVLVITFGIAGRATIAAVRAYRNTAGKEPVYLGPGTKVHGGLVVIGLHRIFHIRNGIVATDAGIEQLRRVTQREILALREMFFSLSVFPPNDTNPTELS